MHLKNYLNFRITSKDYKAKLVAANKDVEALRKKFVQNKFNILDITVKIREEHKNRHGPQCFKIERMTSS